MPFKINYDTFIPGQSTAKLDAVFSNVPWDKVSRVRLKWTWLWDDSDNLEAILPIVDIQMK